MFEKQRRSPLTSTADAGEGERVEGTARCNDPEAFIERHRLDDRAARRVHACNLPTLTRHEADTPVTPFRAATLTTGQDQRH